MAKFPVEQMESYYKKLLKIVKSLEKEVGKLQFKGDYIHHRQQLRSVEKKMAVDEEMALEMAGIVLASVDAFLTSEINAEINSILGYEYAKKSLLSKISAKEWLAENRDLIVGIPERYISKTIEKIEDELNKSSKKNLETRIEKAIERSSEILEHKVRFIAKNEVGNLYAEKFKQQFQGYGLEGYVWRVHPELSVAGPRTGHAERNGLYYTFRESDKLPGEDYQCMCSAEVEKIEVLEKMKGFR